VSVRLGDDPAGLTPPLRHATLTSRRQQLTSPERQGIAQGLLAALLDRLAAAESVAVARLVVNPEQEAAVQVYLGAGFRIVERSNEVLGDEQSHPVFVMEMVLPSP
jgi:hypothetical protein